MDPNKATSNTTESLWRDFLRANPDVGPQKVPISFYFCDNKKDANECAALVVKGIKQATATSLWWHQKYGQLLPKVGDYYIVTDWDGLAIAIIKTTKVLLTPFNKVTTEFARSEGEGDKSLAYWKKVHEAYYRREMEPFNEAFDENQIIVCETFRMVYH